MLRSIMMMAALAVCASTPVQAQSQAPSVQYWYCIAYLPDTKVSVISKVFETRFVGKGAASKRSYDVQMKYKAFVEDTENVKLRRVTCPYKDATFEVNEPIKDGGKTLAEDERARKVADAGPDNPYSGGVKEVEFTF